MRLNVAFFALSVAALLILVYPLAADAGERSWIVDEAGRTVGYLEPAPLSDSRMILRDRDGQTVGVIDRDELGNGHVILDRHGDRLGRLEGQNEQRDRRYERRDWRDGPRERWGSHDDRWGR